MELSELAGRILFATTLEEKLWCPPDVTDERPGSSLDTPAMPGRPEELKFKSQGAGQAEFPGTQRLEQAAERGRLLHFFANHELLATELMALVLLRFPAAPPAFRRGVLQTLKDEQAHTLLYLQRMKECGIQFGELPVSGYFWRAVSTMEHPMDYVAALSLTFEQANLDFCRHFACEFQLVGDVTTAKLLDQVYRDEIGHVAHGLKWFRHWKNPGQGDWEAFCRQLKFPLSPQRAKGLTLNVEGRRAAGLDAEFIAELDVYAQSKGRTPNVFVFNPFAEAFIARGHAFTPNNLQAQLARDLANLPQYLGRQDDVVIVPRRPSVQFLSELKRAGFALPEFVELEGAPGLVRPGGTTGPQVEQGPAILAQVMPQAGPEIGAPSALTSLAQRKLGKLRPWAWGPDSMKLFAPLLARVTGEERTAPQRYNEGLAQLYSKSWSAAFLRRMLALFPREDGLCTEAEAGRPVNEFAQALAAIASIRRRGQHKIVVKEALGLAGHNALRLWEPELLPAQRQWMMRALENGRELVVEPWLERAQDFSAQLEMEPGGLKLRGFTGLVNDAKGQFQANWAAPNFARRIPSAVTALFAKPVAVTARWHRVFEQIFAGLEAELRRVDFTGPLGIDAFVYRATDGTCRLKPIVEINPRYTMGRLTLELMKQVCPGRRGLFRIITRKAAQAEGAEDFPSYARLLQARQPLQLEGQPRSKIRAGALCLNDPAQARSWLAVFEVAP